jgi:hypothetical protein
VVAVMAVKRSMLFRHLLDKNTKQRVVWSKDKDTEKINLSKCAHVQHVRGWAMQEQSTTPNAEANAFVNETHTMCWGQKEHASRAHRRQKRCVQEELRVKREEGKV